MALNNLHIAKEMIHYLNGASILLLENFKSDMHSHYPIEIYVGLDNYFYISFGQDYIKSRAVVIDSNQPHQLMKVKGCVALILLNPSYNNLRALTKSSFVNEKYYQPNKDITLSLIDEINKFRLNSTCNNAKDLINKILITLFSNNKIISSIEPRVQLVINSLDDVPSDKILIQELSKLVNLSESRLAHLFKKETGTSIGRYILWLRLRKAIRAILKNETLTMAAHEGGFSDSAHLSRTYRQMFGITPSSIFHTPKSIKTDYQLN